MNGDHGEHRECRRSSGLGSCWQGWLGRLQKQFLLGEIGIHFSHPGRDSGILAGGEAFWPLSCVECSGEHACVIMCWTVNELIDW
jgi:hypothetical protein